MKTLLAQARGLSYDVGMDIHNRTVLKEQGLRFMNDMPLSYIQKTLDSPAYKKVIVVRHPMERIVSAYKNKFVTTTFSKELNQFIIDNYRTNRTSHDIVPSFEEFVKYVISEYPTRPIVSRPIPSDVSTYAFDGHWRKILHLCHPCQIQYDYILKLETFEADINDIVKLFNGDVHMEPANVPRLNPTSKEYGPLYITSNLPKHLKQSLSEMYESDSKMFGYTFNDNVETKCRIEYSSDNPFSHGTCC